MQIPKNSFKRKAKTIIIYVEVISLLLISFLVYVQVFHESFHLAICIISGNTGKIVFGLPPHVECPGILNSNVLTFWVYCMSPYLFLALPIAAMFSIFKPKTKSYYASLLLIFIPGIALYDTLNNFFRFFMRDNDFNNLLAISPYSFLLGSLVVLLIVLISGFWMKNYWPIFKKTIQERIKEKNNAIFYSNIPFSLRESARISMSTFNSFSSLFMTSLITNSFHDSRTSSNFSISIPPFF